MQRHEAVSPPTDGSDSPTISRTDVPPSASILWISYLSCLVLSSVFFAGLSEWEVYTGVFPNHAANLTFVERGTLFWLLTAKSMVLFLPCLALAAGLLWLGRRRVASGFFASVWILVFCWLLTDLFSYRFSGSHIAEYAPNITDILGAPQEQQWQWIGKGFLLEVALGFGAVTLAAIGTLLAIKHSVARLIKRFTLLDSPLGLVAVTITYMVMVVGVVPALGALNSEVLLRNICEIMPIDTHLLESGIISVKELCYSLTGSDGRAAVDVAMPHLNSPRDGGGELILQNMTSSTLDLTGWRLQDPVGRQRALTGVLKPGQGTRVSVPLSNWISGGDFLVVDQNGWLQYRERPMQGTARSRLILREQGPPSNCSPNVNVDREEATLDKRIVDDAVEPKPVDSAAIVSRKHLPNIILIAVESLHFSATGPGMMPKFDRIADNGLRFCRHYSGSNISQLGIYALLYGRAGITYRSTLERKMPSQLCSSLKGSGYRRSFVTSGEMAGWRRMDEIFSSANFDSVVRLPKSDGKNWLASADDWPNDDRWKLRETLRIASQNEPEPQFVFTFLMSTHYSYACPPEFRIHAPCDLPSLVGWSRTDLKILGNRYKNSVLFLEDELLKLISNLDLEKNIVIITGDHGESLGEDGVAIHGTRASEVQIRTPFVMLGAGISPKRVQSRTTHTDLVPTLLHALQGGPVSVMHTHGRDLLENEPIVDQVVVTPYKQAHITDPVLVISDKNRSLFHAALDAPGGPSIGFSALLDESGHPRPDFSCEKLSTEIEIKAPSRR